MTQLDDLNNLWHEATLTTQGYTKMLQPLKPGSHWYNAEQAYLKLREELGLAPIPIPTPPPSPTPPPPTYYFFDDFNGPARSPPDPTKWWVSNGKADDIFQVSPTKAGNVFLDGAGFLVVQSKRESYLGKAFSGAFCGTFDYDSGWPSTRVKSSFPVPFRYEAVILMPKCAGLWIPGGWLQNVDRSTAQGVYELDVFEMTTTKPFNWYSHQHIWKTGTPDQPADGGISGPDSAAGYNVVAAEVRADSVKYFLNGSLVTTMYGAPGKFGLLLQNLVTDPNSANGGLKWASQGGVPPAGDSGPWQAKYKYVSVTPL